MKKLSTLTLFLLSCFLASAQDGGSVSGAVGRRSKSCDGLGLCTVEKTKPGLTQMHFRLDVVTAVLSFSFSEDDLEQNQPEKLLMLRGKSVFVQEEDMELPADLSRQLGSTSPILIPSGNHQLVYSAGTFTVYVKVNI